MTEVFENNFADFSNVVRVNKKMKISSSGWWRFQLGTSCIAWSFLTLLHLPLTSLMFTNFDIWEPDSSGWSIT